MASWFWADGIGFIRVPDIVFDGARLGPSEIHLSFWKPRVWQLYFDETEWTKIVTIERMRRISTLQIVDRKCLIVGPAAFADKWIGIRCLATINSILPCV
ncbi:hypothetical protein [Neorhodopirellula lusitana]|uniref:hypothetical protein n=1 Tax=Neorhodopirellula lusitana TaxID=445327 RepID=UPI0024B6D700|nr:hypothetical protein [Neorhodopirellula lusitana]